MSSSVARRIRKMTPKAKARVLSRLTPPTHCGTCGRVHAIDTPQCPQRITPGQPSHRI